MVVRPVAMLRSYMGTHQRQRKWPVHWMLFLCLHGLTTFSSSWISLKSPRQMPQTVTHLPSAPTPPPTMPTLPHTQAQPLHLLRLSVVDSSANITWNHRWMSHVATLRVSSQLLLSVVWTKTETGIESIKTTSMEDVSTRVLEKIKNI